MLLQRSFALNSTTLLSPTLDWQIAIFRLFFWESNTNIQTKWISRQQPTLRVRYIKGIYQDSFIVLGNKFLRDSQVILLGRNRDSFAIGKSCGIETFFFLFYRGPLLVCSFLSLQHQPLNAPYFYVAVGFVSHRVFVSSTCATRSFFVSFFSFFLILFMRLFASGEFSCLASDSVF